MTFRSECHARILAYMQEIGWRLMPRTEAEARPAPNLDDAAPEGRSCPDKAG